MRKQTGWTVEAIGRYSRNLHFLADHGQWLQSILDTAHTAKIFPTIEEAAAAVTEAAGMLSSEVHIKAVEKQTTLREDLLEAVKRHSYREPLTPIDFTDELLGILAEHGITDA